MTPPTAEEIYLQVRRERPRGWKRFTMDHARRVHIALDRRNFGEGPTCRPGVPVGVTTSAEFGDCLDRHTVSLLASEVRTDNGAVGFGVGTVITWLAWKLVEAAVWWAIQWAWRRQFNIQKPQ